METPRNRVLGTCQIRKNVRSPAPRTTPVTPLPHFPELVRGLTALTPAEVALQALSQVQKLNFPVLHHITLVIPSPSALETGLGGPI